MSHFEFDIHTHTIASGHGSAATITDMVKTARTQHLNMLGISDHGLPHLAAENLHISEILLMHLKTGWESACCTVPRSVF